MHILDIVQNSIAAEATNIKISLVFQERMLFFTVSDNGRGMDSDFLKNVVDPFVTTRTTRNVGLGIPLLKLSAELAGGFVKVKSEKGQGTEITAGFQKDHIDRIPVGCIDETMKILILSYPELNFELNFRTKQNKYELKTLDVKKTLNGFPIQNIEIVNWIGENIREGLNEVFGGVLDEISS